MATPPTATKEEQIAEVEIAQRAEMLQARELARVVHNAVELAALVVPDAHRAADVARERLGRRRRRAQREQSRTLLRRASL